MHMMVSAKAFPGLIVRWIAAALLAAVWLFPAQALQEKIDQAETVETDEEEPAIGLDSVLLAILADIELKKGNQDRALAYYDVICRTSSHGLVLLYIYIRFYSR